MVLGKFLHGGGQRRTENRDNETDWRFKQRDTHSQADGAAHVVDIQPIDRLRELLTVAEAGELGDDLGSWLSSHIRDYLENASGGRTLDAALGLAINQGEIPWWRQEELNQRNAAFRDLAEKHFGSLDLSRRADEILRAARRYRDGRWRFDRSTEFNPEKYADIRSQLLYKAFWHGHGDVPDSKRQICRILDDTK